MYVHVRCKCYTHVFQHTTSTIYCLVRLLFFNAGALKQDAKPFLIDVQYTATTNHATVAHIVVQALKGVLGEQDKFDKVLLLLSDSAAYMHKMATGMSALLPNCLHVTCLAHGLHRIAETVRTLFNDVDALIANAKKVFRKAPRRISLFKEKNPDLPLPPKPCLTRWGTWLSAALYHADHFEAIVATVAELDATDAEAIGVLQGSTREAAAACRLGVRQSALR